MPIQRKHPRVRRSQQLSVGIESQTGPRWCGSHREELPSIFAGESIANLHIGVGRRLRKEEQNKDEVHGGSPVWREDSTLVAKGAKQVYPRFLRRDEAQGHPL